MPLPHPFWSGLVQAAGGRVGVGQDRPGQGEAGVAGERGRLVAEAARHPTPRFQLLHGNPAWLEL